MRTSIKCNCGQRIIAKDVVQHGYYLRLFGPSFVYVKFRCSRCKKLGEQFIKQEEWEEGILKDHVAEISHEEKETFAAQGPISIDEVLDFHFALEDLNDLKSLETAPPPPKKNSKTRSTPQS
jgi:DNA-directed RNA polymerase subunit RPC12/RpoP